ncbi:uncharacterized protein MONOS_13851 [Monocercomonoides exilis]|uniref:uncharacterized protein n=1 Tax=Monocercomonoides exilis TaxID=2049356 RepID=UPI003559C787|nr:hypothetical protein MONOS_13851 [Monocercomonoides exilis]|eukprot:MONOS_13851.1-p1 / transcript=MONOS_13851.1 / gene=MONOS_13851 / organism=Monocercomonoides_exilis_PA203 / gene_product=unspecified product / transcript_product=unspecified product / location=Mono_scaffold00894:17-1255(-) / protein_length=413 / sequence_SO=supercontig / SO=protein_coding / is_pseudo=false
MTQDPVRMETSNSEDRGFDLAIRLSRVENLIEEMARSRAVPSRSGAVGILPVRKTKRERPRGRSLSGSSESESESDDTEMIAKKRHRQRLRGSRGRNQMKKWDDVETSESDSENTEKREEEQDRSEDFLGIFPDEWLTPRRQAGELKRFMDFCKAGSIRINDDILNTFIPETEKNFFTRHTDISWNALAVTGVTAEGRKDSPEAARVIELLQPALESGFEAAKAIAALTIRELKKTRLEEEEKERLRGLFCAYALIADCISRINLLKVIPQSSWENVKCFLDGGMSKDIPESFRRLVDSTSFFRPGGDAPGYGASPASPTTFGLAPLRGGRSGRYSTGRNAQGFAYRQFQKQGFEGSFSNFKQRRRSTQTRPQQAPATAGRAPSLTVPLPPAPPRTQGESAAGTSSGTSQWA